MNVQRIASFARPTPLGEFDVVCYNRAGTFGFALTRGEMGRDDLLVRVQSACMFGESFLVNSCDCGDQLRKALEIGATGGEPFLMIYLMEQEGRGLGMFQKIKAIEAEVKHGVDMVEAFDMLGLPLDLREYRAAAEILRDVNGDRPIRLMTNNPKKQAGLEECGVEVTARVPLLIEPPHDAMRSYLTAKKDKMGHDLPQV